MKPREERRSLIKAINEAFNISKKEENGYRYSSQTNTLYSNSNGSVQNFSSEMTGSHAEKIEIVCETSEFERKMNGRVKFAVIKADHVPPRSNITIRECKNLIPTGRICVYEISEAVTSTECPGLKPGYCIVGWQ